MYFWTERKDYIVLYYLAADICWAHSEPCTSYSVDELAEYMAKAAGGGTRAQGVDEDKQKALLRQALLHAHNHSADN